MDAFGAHAPLEASADACYLQQGFAGDPYVEAEVTRSICMSGPPLGAGDVFGHDFGFDKDSADFLNFGGGLTKGAYDPTFDLGPVQQKQQLPQSERPEGFSPEHVPPPLPSTPCFRLETSKLMVRTPEPWKVANCLLDCLYEKATVLSMKINRAKFTIKADVQRDFASTCLKLRLYAQPPAESRSEVSEAKLGAGGFWVEAQRRKGDCLAFSSMFNELASALRAHFGDAVEGSPSECAPPTLLTPPPVPELEGDDFEDFAFFPVVDMASRASAAATVCADEAVVPLAELRAELAAELARAAQDAQKIGALRQQPQCLDAVVGLVKASPECKVVVPAALALETLASLAEPEALADSECLEVLTQKLRLGDSMCAASRSELSKALAAAAARASPALGRAQAHKLRADLQDMSLGAGQAFDDACLHQLDLAQQSLCF